MSYVIAAEQAVIGGLIIENSVWDKVSSHLEEKDFSVAKHRMIFSTIASLAAQNKPFDLLTLPGALNATGMLEAVGGEGYIYEVAGNVPSVANIEAYIDLVSSYSMRRKAIALAARIVEVAEDAADDAFLDKISKDVEEFIGSDKKNSADPIRIDRVFKETFDELCEQEKKETVALMTGFTELDNLTSGLHPGEFILIAARPSMGKTTLAMNIAENIISSTNAAVLVFSMEMNKKQIAQRIFSSLGKINQEKLRIAKLNQSDWKNISEVMANLKDANLYIDDSCSLTSSQIKDRAKKTMRYLNGNLKLIVIDYLQLIQEPSYKKDRRQEVEYISRSLKNLAKELNIPIIALSQLNRSLEGRIDKRPIMSDLRDSGSLEQEADLIAFIYRDEFHNSASREKGIAEVIVSKHRNGPVGKINLSFLGEYTRFENFKKF